MRGATPHRADEGADDPGAQAGPGNHGPTGPHGETSPGDPSGPNAPPKHGTDCPFGLFQSIALLLITTCLLLPVAHGLGYWPQQLRVRVVAPAGARLAAIGERALDAATPTWVDHRIAWHVDGKPWSCPLEVAHGGERLRGRLRGENRGGFANAHMPHIDRVESCDGSLWIRTIDRGIEVLAPQPGRAWIACELQEARALRVDDRDEPAAGRWCRALPAGTGEHRLACGAWTAEVAAAEGTTVQLCELPASEPFVRIELDDTGFAGANVQHGGSELRAVVDGHREANDGAPILVHFPGATESTSRSVHIRLQLRTDAAIGLLVRASRRR
ncbi:MAG: hypothetical protein ACK501_05905 [Planctomycetota bacterium]|jgi:hypothetical protein